MQTSINENDVIARLLGAIRLAWSTSTASPGRASGVRMSHNAAGQCAVTALLVQDIFGGEIVRASLRADLGGSHYWNRIPGMGDIDLTREQFHPDDAIPSGYPVRREYLLEGERALIARTRQRYELLRERFTHHLDRTS